MASLPTSTNTAATAAPAPYNPRADDPRLANIITPGTDGDVVLIGFPFDEGCTRNGGRAGAKEGPLVFEKLLAVVGTVVNPELGIDLRGPHAPSVTYAGCIDDAALPLEDAHRQLEALVAQVLAAGRIPFVIGGGNDQSAPNGRALLSTAPPGAQVGVVNIDAHLDVRKPLPDGRVHSGTPFRELLEDGRLCGTRFVEFACQGAVCSAAHAAYVTGKGGCLHWLGDVQRRGTVAAFDALFAPDGPLSGSHNFVSFDIDAVCSADCPGVSAPAAVGLSGQEALDICRCAGRHPSVCLMDISELNPVVEGYRSPRLAVLMFYHFLLGLTERRALTAQKAQ